MATISIILGSIRPGRAGEGVAQAVRDIASKHNKVHFIDPASSTDLQVFTYPYRYMETPSEPLKEVHTKLVESDAIILVTPEYNHGYSGVLKNLLDFFYDIEFRGKPFGIVSYSASPFGGIRAAEQLRQVITELGGISTPMNLIIPTVGSAIKEGAFIDPTTVARAEKFLKEVNWYAQALATQRKIEMVPAR